MKILTVCQKGHCRSVALKILLGKYMGHDVLSCGYKTSSMETLRMLFEWADKVVILTKAALIVIEEKYKDKVVIFDIGHDIWINPTHPDLQENLKKLIKEYGLFGQIT